MAGLCAIDSRVADCVEGDVTGVRFELHLIVFVTTMLNVAGAVELDEASNAIALGC